MHDISELNKYDQTHCVVVRAIKKLNNVAEHYREQMRKYEERIEQTSNPKVIQSNKAQYENARTMWESRNQAIIGSVIAYFEQSPTCVGCGKALPVSSIRAGSKKCSTCYRKERGTRSEPRRESKVSGSNAEPFYLCTFKGTEDEVIYQIGGFDRKDALRSAVLVSMVKILPNLPEDKPARYLIVDQGLSALLDADGSWEYMGFTVEMKEGRVSFEP